MSAPLIQSVMPFHSEPEPTAAPAQAEPEPAVAEPEPAVAEPEPTAATADLDVEAEVLAVVAAKTGYPADMLDLDLDLEADLGIDTVKQAEVFALIRERFDIERDDIAVDPQRVGAEERVLADLLAQVVEQLVQGVAG